VVRDDASDVLSIPWYVSFTLVPARVAMFLNLQQIYS
jgi:hypothetical protein